MASQSSRVDFLDGLRTVAIFAVILYHYFVRWAPPVNVSSLYPYDPLFNDILLIRHGHYGVQLFFIISGFVISMTLLRCATWQSFFLRRFVRLFPAMAVCSTLTYAALTIIPFSPFATSVYHFLPSLTFIDPIFFNKLLGVGFFAAMDGAYWSLFVEVKFYILISSLYFANRQTFVRNFLLICILLVAVGVILYKVDGTKFGQWIYLTNGDHFLWFLIGIGFYFEFASEPTPWTRLAIIFGVLLSVVFPLIQGDIAGAIIGVLLPGLFFAVMHIRALQRILSATVLTSVGRSSYSLYLIHQYLGLALIIFASSFFGLTGITSLIVPIGVMLFLTVFSLFLYRYFESPLNKLALKHF
jgi:peptidoglycan/LPS O-acetylase OafA/YrhL